MKTNLKLGISIVLALTSLAVIGCGDDSEEQPFCRDGVCGDGGAGGGETGSNCNNACQSPTTCNTVTNQCEYSNSACAACGAGTYCDTSTNPDSCKPNNNPGNCGSNCGPGTTCMNGACVPGSGGSGGGGNNCNGACGAGTHCNTSTNHCDPNGSGGSGGDGGASGGVDVTWIPTLSTSTLGYVNAQLTSDGSFTPGQTIGVFSSDGITAVCAVLYGPQNKVTCNNGSCRYVNALKNVLAPKHGQSASNESYVAGTAGLMDAANDLVSCAIAGYGTCSTEFLERCYLTNNTCQDNDAVGNSQSQIACALVGVP